MADDAQGDSAQGLRDLNTTQQSGVRYLGLIIQAIQKIFPQQTGTATTATSGAATLPGNPVGFIVVSLPNGTSVKVPYYGG